MKCNQSTQMTTTAEVSIYYISPAGRALRRGYRYNGHTSGFLSYVAGLLKKTTAMSARVTVCDFCHHDLVTDASFRRWHVVSTNVWTWERYA